MIVINEKKFVEDILNGKINVFKKNLPKTKVMACLIKYYKHKEVDDIYEKVVADMKYLFKDDFKEEKSYHLIHNAIKSINVDETFTKESVEIYKCDIDIIKTIGDKELEKLLFTIYCYARYYNNNGWVMVKDRITMSRMFKRANVEFRERDRGRILGLLEKLGYVTSAKNQSNINVKVDIENKDKVEFKITNFDNLGKQYVVKYKDGYSMCARCGNIFKLKAKGRKGTLCHYCRDK